MAAAGQTVKPLLDFFFSFLIFWILCEFAKENQSIHPFHTKFLFFGDNFVKITKRLINADAHIIQSVATHAQRRPTHTAQGKRHTLLRIWIYSIQISDLSLPLNLGKSFSPTVD